MIQSATQTPPIQIFGPMVIKDLYSKEPMMHTVEQCGSDKELWNRVHIDAATDFGSEARQMIHHSQHWWW